MANLKIDATSNIHALSKDGRKQNALGVNIKRPIVSKLAAYYLRITQDNLNITTKNSIGFTIKTKIFLNRLFV